MNEEQGDLGGGGSGGGSEPLFDDEPQEDAIFDEGDDDGEEDSSSLPPSNNAPAGWDPDTFAAAITKGLAPVLQKQNTPPPKEMTDEEFRALTKYRAVQKEELALILNPDTPIEEKIAAMQSLLDGTATHAVNVNALMQKRLRGEIDAQYSPLLTQAQQGTMNKFLGKVEKFSPAFRGKGQVIQQVMAQMAQNGYQTQGEAKDIENVALMAKKYIRTIDPNFKLTRPVRGGGRAGMPNQASSVNGAGGGYNGGGQRGKQPGFLSLKS